MNARWQALSARYAALNGRERIMVAVAVVLAVGLGGLASWVDPPRARAALLQKQIAQQQQETAALRPRLADLKAMASDPDAAAKSALADVKGQLTALERDAKSYENILVPPRRVPQLLQTLLSRHRGLDLLDMRTLEPAPLIERRSAKPGGGADTVSPPAPPPPDSGNIFRHGIEIKVAGGYGDLLAYVVDLERSPQKVLWERMSLVVKAYPRSELTLTVYTLSFDSTWLVV
jgi:MSHA biogenesis protein MshJ